MKEKPDEPELPLDLPDEPPDSEQKAPRPLEMQVCIGACHICPHCRED